MKTYLLSSPAVAVAVVLVGIQLVLASVPESQSKPVTPDIQALDSYINGELKAKGLVGLSVALMIDGTVVLAKGYGLSALDGSPATPETPFAIRPPPPT